MRHQGLYRFRRDGNFKNRMETNEYGIDYYVKSGFDKKYPAGTSARADIEKKVIKDYVEFGQDVCKRELKQQWRSDDFNYPTPNYGIFKNRMETNEYGIDYYVKSGFDKKYPAGTSARADIEKKVIKDYVEFGQDVCKRELKQQWRSDDLNYPTPNCDKLRQMRIKPIA
ncbi:chaperone protein dnaJ 49 [Artemisia annua]|uniref:Chaperone protein dnaJ 49 n=1 Tax=Artemisia annua TaxID=35608 RepID=A0A2U1LMA2_ARTAN|nr:chaperone protein dnaJ 49 [Artemisia annua]